MKLKIYHTSKYNTPILYPFPHLMLHKHRQQTLFSGEVWVKTKTIQKCCDLHGTVWAIVSQIVGESFVQTLFSKRYLKEKTFTILHTNYNTISIFVILRKIHRIYLLGISAIFQRWGWKKKSWSILFLPWNVLLYDNLFDDSIKKISQIWFLTS